MTLRLAHFSTALLLGITLLTMSGANAAGTQTHKTYRWVDKQGEVFYGDKIPPEYAAQGSTELSQEGVVVKTNAPPLTEEQRAEAQRQEKLKAEQDRIAKEKTAHDRMLLSTFSTEEDLILTRNGKVASIDAMISATKSRNQSLEKSLAGMRATAAERERNGQVIPDKLRKEIAAMHTQINDNISYIASKQREQETLRTQFETDLERFRELKAAQLEAQKKTGNVTSVQP
jgi:hypothetical protein